MLPSIFAGLKSCMKLFLWNAFSTPHKHVSNILILRFYAGPCDLQILKGVQESDKAHKVQKQVLHQPD